MTERSDASDSHHEPEQNDRDFGFRAKGLQCRGFRLGVYFGFQVWGPEGYGVRFLASQSSARILVRASFSLLGGSGGCSKKQI